MGLYFLFPITKLTQMDQTYTIFIHTYIYDHFLKLNSIFKNIINFISINLHFNSILYLLLKILNVQLIRIICKHLVMSINFNNTFTLIYNIIMYIVVYIIYYFMYLFDI